MKTIFLRFFLCLISMLGAGPAMASSLPGNARVSIRFVDPAGFTDLAPRHASERERAGVLRALGAAMQRSAAQYLRDDLQLEIAVKNVDRAGDFEWWRGAQAHDLRVLRDLYPPRMTIGYQLRDPRGRVLSQGETRLSNQNYLFGIHPDSDPLRHDKALFRDWLRTEFSEFRK